MNYFQLASCFTTLPLHFGELLEWQPVCCPSPCCLPGRGSPQGDEIWPHPTGPSLWPTTRPVGRAVPIFRHCFAATGPMGPALGVTAGAGASAQKPWAPPQVPILQFVMLFFFFFFPPPKGKALNHHHWTKSSIAIKARCRLSWNLPFPKPLKEAGFHHWRISGTWQCPCNDLWCSCRSVLLSD